MQTVPSFCFSPTLWTTTWGRTTRSVSLMPSSIASISRRRGSSAFVPTTRAARGYDPADLLKLYIYGYLNRVRSSRAGTATITVIDDAEDDDGETIVLDAASTTPALTAAPLTLTITDNDATPVPATLTLSADSAPAEGGEPVTVTAMLDNPAPADGLTVTLTTGGTATRDTDYTLSSTTITLAAGETAGTVTLTVIDDAEDDDGETIVLDAASTTPALTAALLTLTITDNDATPVPALPRQGVLWLGLLLTGLGAVRLRLRGRHRADPARVPARW